jgi:hypothetical protein
VDWGEQIGRPREIFRRQLEEQCFACVTGADEAANFSIVGAAVGDRVIEDCRVGGKTGDRELRDVALEGAAIEQVPGNIIEP